MDDERLKNPPGKGQTDYFDELLERIRDIRNILRDDGLSYGDYVEQLTFLLFLKMADEQSRPPFNKPSRIPKGFDWSALLKVEGDELEVHYRRTLEELGKKSGLLGLIFRKAQNKIQDPAKLRRLIVDLIGKEQWTSLGVDVKGDAYEGLLQKNAEDVKSGAGQYFTPRALIAAMVEVVGPHMKYHEGSMRQALRRIDAFLDAQPTAFAPLMRSFARQELTATIDQISASSTAQEVGGRASRKETSKLRALRLALRIHHMDSIAAIAKHRLLAVPDFSSLTTPRSTVSKSGFGVWQRSWKLR